MTVNGVSEYQWRATMSGLAPAARYCYRVEFGTAAPVIDLLGADPSISFSAQLPAGAPAPFSFAVLGDFGAVGTTEAGVDNRQADVMTQIAKSGVRFVMGDRRHRLSVAARRRTTATSSDRLGRQHHLRASVLAEGRRLDPVLQRHGEPRLQQHLPADWPQPNAASGLGRAATRWTPTAARTGRTRPPTRAPGTRSTRASRASTCSRPRGARPTSARRTSTRTTTTRTGRPGSPEYQWLAKDLAGAPVAAQVRLLPLPDVLVERDRKSSDPWLRGSEQPRGPARPQRRGDRLQRPRAQLHAQREARRRAGHLRHGRRRGSAAAGHEVQRAGGVRDRLVVHDRRQRLRHAAADLDRAGVPLPEGHRRRHQGHGRAHRLAGADVRRAEL